MKNWLKATLLTLVLSFSVMGWGQSVNFFTDRAVGTYPIPGQTGVTALVPVQYGQVRVCNFSATPGIPCASLATITDINGNPLSVSGGNFGQLSTDVVGRFSFGCTPGTILTIQVSAVSSNTPLLNYPTTCPFASSGSTIDAIFNSVTAGAGTFTSINNIQTINTNTAGADICAKIATGIAALPTTGGTVDARFFQGVQACASNPFSSASIPVNLILGHVTIQSSVPWIVSASNIQVFGAGMGKTTFQYVGGATPAFVKIATATPTANLIQQITWKDMLIQGSANTTDVVLLQGVMRSHFSNIAVKDATQSCWHVQWEILNEYSTVMCSNQTNGPFSQTPTNGFLIDQIDASHFSTTGTFLNPIVEGVSGSGIKISGGSNYVFVSGTTEDNGNGIEVTSNVNNTNDVFISPDTEANGTDDALLNGIGNLLINYLGTNRIHVGANSRQTRILGGTTNNLTIDAGAVNTLLDDVSINTLGTGVLTDNGTDTVCRSLINVSGNAPAGCPWKQREINNSLTFSGIGAVDRQDYLRAVYQFSSTPFVISNTVLTASKPWRVIFLGVWANNFEGGGLAQLPPYLEVTSASPTFAVGSSTLTVSENASNQLQVAITAGSATVVGFSGTIFITSNNLGSAGNASIAVKDPITIAGTPVAKNFASGTAAMTTAAIASGACGTTVTVTAANVTTSDVIDFNTNASVTTPNGLLVPHAWPTSGNVNFNYCNPTAASQTPTAATVNWSVRR